jgi:hypothetical protein
VMKYICAECGYTEECDAVTCNEPRPAAFGVQLVPWHHDWIMVNWHDKPVEYYCELCWDKMPEEFKDKARAEREYSLMRKSNRSVTIRGGWGGLG